MKKIKLIFLVGLVFVITGCDVNYNLTIEENSMTESVDFLYDNTAENKSIIDNYLKSDYMAYYDMDSRTTHNYEKKEIENDNNVGMNLSYRFQGDRLQNSSLLDMCYYKKSIVKTDDEIVITTDGKTTCFYKDTTRNIDRLVINITTDLKVTENNADEVDGNTYKWIIDDSNYQNHPITMKIDLTEKSGIPFVIIALCIIGSIVVLGVIILIHIRIKNKKNNEL